MHLASRWNFDCAISGSVLLFQACLSLGWIKMSQTVVPLYQARSELCFPPPPKRFPAQMLVFHYPHVTVSCRTWRQGILVVS